MEAPQPLSLHLPADVSGAFASWQRMQEQAPRQHPVSAQRTMMDQARWTRSPVLRSGSSSGSSGSSHGQIGAMRCHPLRTKLKLRPPLSPPPPVPFQFSPAHHSQQTAISYHELTAESCNTQSPRTPVHTYLPTHPPSATLRHPQSRPTLLPSPRPPNPPSSYPPLSAPSTLSRPQHSLAPTDAQTTDYSHARRNPPRRFHDAFKRERRAWMKLSGPGRLSHSLLFEVILRHKLAILAFTNHS